MGRIPFSPPLAEPSPEALRLMAGWARPSTTEGEPMIAVRTSATPSRYLELKAEKERIEAEMEAARLEEAEGAADTCKELIEAYGLTPDQVFSVEALREATRRPRPTTSTVPPKYRNPDDHTQTWGGKGGVPTWYRDKLAKGIEAKDMLIDPNDTTTAKPRGRPPKANAELRGHEAVR